jgi:hypothetical protein
LPSWSFWGFLDRCLQNVPSTMGRTNAQGLALRVHVRKGRGLAIERFLFSLSKQSISRNTEIQEGGEWETRKGKKNRHGAFG